MQPTPTQGNSKLLSFGDPPIRVFFRHFAPEQEGSNIFLLYDLGLKTVGPSQTTG